MTSFTSQSRASNSLELPSTMPEESLATALGDRDNGKSDFTTPLRIKKTESFDLFFLSPPGSAVAIRKSRLPSLSQIMASRVKFQQQSESDESAESTEQANEAKETVFEQSNPLEQMELMESLAKLDPNDDFSYIIGSQIKSQIHRSSIIRPLQKSQYKARYLQMMFKTIVESRGITIIWVFIIKNASEEVDSQLDALKTNLCNLWNSQPGVMITKNKIPIFKSFKKAENFFKMRNCMLNLVVDLQNAQTLFQIQNRAKKIIPQSEQYIKKLISVSLYLSQKGLSETQKIVNIKRANDIKRKCNKVIIHYDNIKYLIDRAQIDIEDSMELAAGANLKLPLVRVFSCLPLFFKLNGQDNSDIKNYRFNVYGSIFMKNKAIRKLKKQNFIKFVENVHSERQNENNQINKYKAMKNQVFAPQDEEKNKQVLLRYTEQSFYHRITNNLLRIVRTPQEFKYVEFPFNEIFHAIKFFYKKLFPCDIYKKRKIKHQVLYRGTSLKLKEFYALKEGDFIEMMGFPSASKNKQIVKDLFMRRKNSFLFEITIKERVIPAKFKDFDNGFADLDFYKFSQPKHFGEEEVLLNALNIYKVVGIVPPNKYDDFYTIKLEYGAIFDIMEAKAEDLTEEEQRIRMNFAYCISQMQSIEKSQINVLKLQQRYRDAQKQIEEKLKEKQITKEEKIQWTNQQAINKIKLGKIQEAGDRALSVFNVYKEDMQALAKGDPKNIDKIIKEVEKTRSVLEQTEHFQEAKQALEMEMDLVKQDEKQWLFKAHKLFQKADISLKEEDWVEGQRIFKESQKILTDKRQSLEMKRKQIEHKYQNLSILNRIKNYFNSNAQQETEANKQAQLKAAVEEYEQDFKSKEFQVNNLLLGIYSGLMAISMKRGEDIKILSERKKKCEELLEMVNIEGQNELNACEKANRKVLRANVKYHSGDGDEDIIIECEKEIDSAINMVEQLDEFDPKLIEYMKMKGDLKKSQIKKNLEVTATSESEQTSNPFDSAKLTTLYSASKKAYGHALQKAQQIHALNLDNSIILLLKNQIGSIQFDFAHYDACVKIARQVLDSKRGPNHSEGSKSALQIGKVYLLKGQIEAAQQYVIQSFTILSRAYIKEKSPKSKQIYVQIMQLSPIFREAKLLHCRIFNKQKKFQQSHQELQKLITIGGKKLTDSEGAGYLAEIYQEIGLTFAQQNKQSDFFKNTQNAIQLRTHERGHRQNIPNAVCYCRMAIWLFSKENTSKGDEYLKNCQNIFARVQNHPESWLEFSARAYRAQFEKDSKSELYWLKETARLIETYSESHISRIEIKLRAAVAKRKNKMYEDAKRDLEEIERDLKLDQSIKELMSRNEISQQQKQEMKMKNEKISIHKTLKEELRIVTNRILQKQQMNRESFEYISPQKPIKFSLEFDTPETNAGQSPMKIS